VKQPLIRIWDCHTHLSGFPGDTPEARMAALVELADRMGIERFVTFMGWPFDTDPSPDELVRQNDQVLQALAHWHDRALGFAYVNPRHEQASLAEIDRCVRDGPMVGIKLWVAVRASDPRLDPIVERAAELSALIFQHTWYKATGNLPGESTGADLAVLAHRHPRAQFLCGHTGGDWELGLPAVRERPNVAVETGGSDPTSGMIEMCVRELGAERIVFGSDTSGRSLATQLGKVQGARISEADRGLILGGNLRRLVAPILAKKGFAP
jgi:hypothetical protein